MSLKRKMKKGFTLVELVVVIAVIAILSAVSVGAYFGITDSANTSRCEQEAKGFHTALVLIANDPSDAAAKFDSNNNVVIDETKIEASIETQLGYKVDVITTGETETVGGTEVKEIDGVINNSNYKAEVKFEETTFTYGVSGKTVKIDIKTGAKVTATA